MTRTKRSKDLLLTVTLAVALAAVTTAAFFVTISAAEADEISYLDINGDTQRRDNVAEVGQAFFGESPAYELDDSGATEGWYIVNDDLFIPYLTVVGNVSIIIADGCVLTVGAGITVAGGNLSVYSQPVVDAKGKLTAESGHCVTLDENSTFTNTAHVSASGPGNYAISSSTGALDVQVTNGDAGLIEGECGIYFPAAGSVDDENIQVTAAAIRASGGVAKIVNRNGTIRGLDFGIWLGGSSYVESSGTIEGTGTGSTGIFIAKTSIDPWINNFDGTIRGGQFGVNSEGAGGGINNYGSILGGKCGIQFADTLIDNRGTIEGSSDYGIFVAGTASGSVIINNNLGSAAISGGRYGIMLQGPGKIYNVGEIKGTAIDSAGIRTAGEGVAEIDNAGGSIRGLYAGIQLGGSSYIQSSGTIEGTADGSAGIFIADTSVEPWIDNNYGGTIKGENSGVYSEGTGGGVSNHLGMIGGGKFGVFAGGPISLLNNGMIDGSVVLADAMNKVSFGAGSKINGDLTIGANPESTLEFFGVPESLLYSTVNGNVDIGTAYVSINLEDTSLDQGAVLVLIDGSAGTMKGSPANPTASAGKYSFDLSVKSNKLIAVVSNPFIPVTPSSAVYYLTAAAGPGAAISPEGTSTVVKGSSKTFRFAADEGYTVSSVTVDGMPLSQDQIASGYHTFFDVQANHTISVSSRTLRTDITLRIDIAMGKGHADYSVNGGPFIPYTEAVSLQEFSNIHLKAHAASGYQFGKWEDGDKVYDSAEIPLYDVGAPVYLELYFEGGGGGIPLWAAGILLLLAAIGVRLLLRSKTSQKE